ncbi:MAG: GNAT family N-acetyltransferase [Bacteroidales bacterium]|jgi:diamine N-acetyltransferase|nr:GNAT family N-acetyltransferase [Bacteroidales bacterium]
MTIHYNSCLQTPEVKLRALEASDVELLYEWENYTEVWQCGCTVTPFSHTVLREYIANAHLDIYSVKQLRLMIESIEISRTVGMIDLYDFDPHHSRAGLAIFIRKDCCNKHFAHAAITSMLHYCKEQLLLHQIYAEVPETNEASQALFRSCGFSHTGTKTEWLKRSDGYESVLVFQRIL